jgi:FtsP/CotA-like multicopper oxidase with cupredoxin domain
MKRVGELRQQAERYRRLKRQIDDQAAVKAICELVSEAEMTAAELEKRHFTRERAHEIWWQIATDGNLLPNAVKVNSVRIAVAERVDIIVDFAEIFKRTGKSRLYFVNRAEQVNGRGPTGRTLTPGTPVLQVNMIGDVVKDEKSTDPALGATGPVGMPLRALPDVDFAALQKKAATLPTRSWRFERGNGGWMVNGKFFDENVVNAAIPRGSEEVWTIQNPGGSPGVTRCTSTSKSTGS